MERLWLAGGAFLGGILLSLLRWAECHDPFDPRKFMGSVIRAFISGLIFAIKAPEAPVDFQMVVIALLTGAGTDVTLNTVATLVTGNGSFPIGKLKKED